MSNIKTNGSPQLKLIRSYVQGIEKRNIGQAGNTLHKELRCITYPQSAGRLEQTKEESLTHIGGFVSLCTEDCEVSYVGGCQIFFCPQLNQLT